MCQDNQHATFQLIGGGIAVCGGCGEEVQLPGGVELRRDVDAEIEYLESLLPSDYWVHLHWTAGGMVRCGLVDCGYKI